MYIFHVHEQEYAILLRCQLPTYGFIHSMQYQSKSQQGFIMDIDKLILKILWKCHKLRIANTGASLVAQWLRIRLPMWGTWVRALVQEHPTCHGAAKPMRHNYWACALEPTSHNYWAHVPQLLKPARLEPVLCNKRSHRNEKPMHHNKE